MKMRTSRLVFFGFLAIVLGTLAAGCAPVSPQCAALESAVIGTWVGFPSSQGWPPKIITLSANHAYSSRYSGSSESEVGLWSLGYDPDTYVCDVLFVRDTNNVMRHTYGLRMDGDYMVIVTPVGADTYYYREGTTPPSAD